MVDSIVAGQAHTCVIHSGGTGVRCWGLGSRGRLGLPNRAGKNVGDTGRPSRDVVFGSGKLLDIDAGDEHTCILVDDMHRVRCWGNGGYGRLGYGDLNSVGEYSDPAWAGDVNTGPTLQVAEVVTGSLHSCARFTTGRVRCWGANANGYLGYGHTERIGDDETPFNSNFLELGGSVAQLSLGRYHSCALMDNGTVRCWGSNASGQLGIGDSPNIGDDESPDAVAPVALPAKAIRVEAAERMTCALVDTGDLYCWGRNADGQLGIASTVYQQTPTTPVGLDGKKVVDFAVGGNHVCAKVATGEYYCWGDGDKGKLGYGNSDSVGDNELPYLAGPVSVW